MSAAATPVPDGPGPDGPLAAGRVTVSVLAPAQLVGLDSADRLRASRPELDVHFVPYVETNEHRAARRTGRLHEVATPLPELADDHRRWLEASVAVLALDVPSGLPDLAPGLRLVHAAGAGTEWFDHAGLQARGIPLCNASGVAAAPIAEFMLARILVVYKGLRRIEALQREHRWQPQFGRELAGSTLGIVGLGGIGRAVAVRARAFDVTVLGTRRSARPGDVDPDVDELWPLDRLDEMLGRCDIVLLAAPAGPETDDMFDAARFAAMKRGSVFCNVARGSLVVEAALLDALHSDHLAAAVLDVTRHEPAPPDDPLWDEPNVYLSPHCSSSMDRYAERLIELFADNLDRLLAGEELRNVVNGVDRSQRRAG